MRALWAIWMNLDVPRTLLLTPTRPGEGSVAEVFLRDFCRMFQHDRLCCFAAVGAGYEIGIPSADLTWLPMVVRQLPLEWAGAIIPYDMQSVLVSHRRLAQVRIACSELAKEVIAYAKEQKIEQIAAVVAGPATIYLAKAVAEELRVPILPIIWDPIDYVARNRGYHSHAARRVIEDFAALMSRSARAAVASHGMKAHIESQYGVPSEVMISPVDPPVIDFAPETHRSDNEFRIAFAGSLYAENEFLVLLQALNHLDWKVDGRPLALWVMGHLFSLPITSPGKIANFRFLGFRQPKEALELLRQTDIGFIPYWFDEQFDSAVRQCFPNKLSLYFSANLPVLFHGPGHSSVCSFLERYPAGISCTVLDVISLAETIQTVARDPGFNERTAIARERAIAEELGIEPTRVRWQRFVGAQPSVEHSTLVGGSVQCV